MKNKNIKVIVFDLGNVLIPFDYKRILRNMNKIDNNLGERFLKKYYDNYHIHKKYEKWEISDDEFIKILMEWSEEKIDPERLKHIYSDLFEVNDNVTSLLPKLKKRYNLVLLSNTNFIHQKYGWEKYEFLKSFDKLILSHEVGATKPDEKIYKAVEDYTKQPPETHIFIDDIPEYVDGAKKLGWNGINFTNYESLISDFIKHGMSPL